MLFPINPQLRARALERGAVALEPFPGGGGFTVLSSAVGEIVGAPHGVVDDMGIPRLG